MNVIQFKAKNAQASCGTSGRPLSWTSPATSSAKVLYICTAKAKSTSAITDEKREAALAILLKEADDLDEA